MDISPYQGVGGRGPEGGIGPTCKDCGWSTWVELAGGPSDDVYHPNIDKRPLANVDIVHNLEEGIPFHNGHAQKLKMVDVINYLTQEGARVFLRECFRVLAPGGSLWLRTVDLPWVCEMVTRDKVPYQGWLEALFHSPDTADGPLGEGFHRWGYSFESLKAELEAAGFVRVEHKGWYNRWEFKCEAFKP